MKAKAAKEEKRMVDFLIMAKEVDRICEGIWKKYHIESMQVFDGKPIVKVSALVVNEWTKEKYVMIFEEKFVDVLQVINICKY